MMLQRIHYGSTYQTLRTFHRYRLDADGGGFGESYPGDTHLLLQELKHFLQFRCTCSPLNTGIDIFGIFTKDGHMHLLGMQQRSHHPLEPSYRSQAHIEVELLAQGHIEGTYTFSYGSGERPLDTNQMGTECLHRLLRQPVAHIVKGFLTRQHFFPLNLSLTAV